jgi:hypothetical protein
MEGRGTNERESIVTPVLRRRFATSGTVPMACSIW